MKSIKTLQFQLSHIAFTLVFTTSVFVVCNALVLEKIVKWFRLGEDTDYLGVLAYLLVGLCIFIFVFLLFAHRWIIKPVALFFIMGSTSATYFVSKYNVAIDRTMVQNVLHTDLTEVSGLLSVYMIPYVLFLTLLPAFLLAKTHVTFNGTFRYLISTVIAIFVVLAVGTGALYLKYNTIHRAVNISEKYLLHILVPVNFVRSLGSIAHRSVRSYQRRQKKNTKITAQVTSSDNMVVVLAIGESSRLRNFSLYGYDRKNTNPILSTYDDLHLLKGKASIGTTRLALLDILDRDDVKLPAITSVAGIDTSCYVNFKLYDNCDAVGEIRTQNCGHDGNCYDEDVVPLLEKNLAAYESGPRFIILHLGGGSHGPLYYKRHPPEFQQFKPQCLEADVLNHCTAEQLFNSYDNTILYVDHVLGQIIDELDDSGVPYVLIYLSDHGESLLEEGRIFHGMPPGISLPSEQAEVPLIVRSSVPISIVERDEYPQQEVFDTVLDLLSVKTNMLRNDKVFITKAGGNTVESAQNEDQDNLPKPAKN